MKKTRKIGFGLAMVFGLMLTVPAMAADDPCVDAMNHIREAQGTLTQLKALGRRSRRGTRSWKRRSPPRPMKARL